jgi:uncharacterized protein YndB with AHSA1/START domain
MPNQNFAVTMTVDETPSEVFEAINNIKEWWTGEPGVQGSANKVDDEFTYRHQDIHYSKQKVTELVPGKRITWLITESQLNFVKDKDEWTGTQIRFEIFEKSNGTELRFTHIGLTQGKECYNDCSTVWTSYVRNSLKKFITQSKLRTV